MQMDSNGTATATRDDVAVGNETEHYASAERWLAKAERLYIETSDSQHITLALRFAEVHAQLSVAADDDRVAGCVDESGTRLRTGVRPV
jgi:hypothetical protein